ncbi:MAG: M48 family metalloprotease [Aquisalinus sp.]|nr:M48 family metalloprotease [Aquisalinus sp.]
MFRQNKSIRLLVLLPALFLLGTSGAFAQSFLRDAEIEQFLEDYSRPLFEAAGLPAESVGIHLIGDPSLNAFVANGLNMYVFTGLITAAEVPNEIEGVIAHETGHMAGGHLQRSDEAIRAASRPMMLSLVLGTAAIIAGAPDAGIGIIGLGQQVGQANFLSYSRGQESRADQAAITYLDDVGSSSQGLVDFFRKLRNQQIITFNQANPYYQTHPLANSRMTALEARVQESENLDNVDTEEEIMRLKMIQAKIHGFLQNSQTTLRQYPLADTSAPARYARAVAYYRGSNLNAGLREIDSLIAEQPENPFFYELKGQMLFEHGRIAESVEPHRRSSELAPQYALLKVNHARALVALEREAQMNEAIDILKLALNMEPDNIFGWTELARAYSAIGRDDLAAFATAEAYFNAGVPHEAHRFATRASKLLNEQTPEWRQANDIIRATAEDAAKFQRRNPDPGARRG